MKIVLHEMGTYAHVQQLAKALAAKGHQVDYLYCSSVANAFLLIDVLSPRVTE